MNEKQAKAQAAYFNQMVDRQNSAIIGGTLEGMGTTAGSPRVALLEEAIKITTHDRNASYGNPEDNLANIAAYWNSYLTQRAPDATVLPHLNGQDVAHMMILMKLARLATNPGHRDSLVDVAGYAACGEDCRAANQKQIPFD